MESILKLLLNESFVEHAILWQAPLLLFIGIVLGIGYGLKIGSLKIGLIRGGAIGFLGPLMLIMWKVYGAITEHFGLDRVINLGINLIVFIVVGLGMGFVYRYLFIYTDISLKSAGDEKGANKEA